MLGMSSGSFLLLGTVSVCHLNVFTFRSSSSDNQRVDLWRFGSVFVIGKMSENGVSVILQVDCRTSWRKQHQL